ncbi:MAG: 2,3-diphosphoglycerate-dependent phosphoglycerate mutase [Acidimicrobiales bacterium]
MDPTTPNLILLRHGQSQWNLENRFTGWFDVGLTDQGRAEATSAGERLAGAGILPDLLHTSLQTRAIATADLALASLDRLWIPVRRHWRLNERHYGGLTGLNKDEMRELHGEEQVHIWRRSYDVPPPPMPDGHPDNPNTDPRYASVPPDVLPTTECLADVVERMLPYWFDAVCPDLASGATVMVAAHGNSLRALVKHLQGISDDEIPSLNIPTGVPLLYTIGSDFRPTDDRPVEDRYLT